MRIWKVPSQAEQVKAQAPGLGEHPVARSGAPIVLTSELGVIAAGSSAVFPSLGLQPGIRTAYWIDEVRISVGNVYANSVASALPAALRLQFETGAYKVCRAPVPACSFAQVYGFDEYDVGPTAGGAIFESVNFRWLLPKPLYMPAGDVLQCSVERDVSLASDRTMRNICISYHGRTAAPGTPPPAVRHIPWVTHYKHPYSSLYSETKDEFRNPFLRPLTVQRLIARYVDYNANPGIDPTVAELLGPAAGAQTQYPGLYALATGNNVAYVEAKMLDSMGYMIAPVMSPLGTIIDPERAAWTFNRQLSGREQISVAFQTVLPTTPQAYFFDVFLSMVGYREEPV